MKIRLAQTADLETLGVLFSNAKQFMCKMGNPDQWQEGYPHDLLPGDIEKKQLFVCEEDGHIYAAFVLVMGDDPTYAVIKGEWKNHLPYGTLHRIASTGERRGMMDVIVDWAFEKTGGNLRGDTHELNLPMQTAFERNGFERCGIIWVEDGTPRIAYHKTK